MFDSISKAWNEVSGEGEVGGVKFADSAKKGSKKTDYYIHYDKPKLNPLERVRKAEGNRKGSPRILKPANEGRVNSVLGSALKNLTKVFKRDDGELGDMKEYMNGMIKASNDRQGLNRRSRSSTLNLEELDSQGTGERSSRRRRRTDTISSKLESLSNSFSTDRKRRRRYETEVKYQASLPPKYNYSTGKDLDDIEKIYTSKHDLDKEFKHNTYNLDDDFKYDFQSSTSLNRKTDNKVIDASWKKKDSPLGTSSEKKGIQFKKLTALDLPSSPTLFESNKAEDKKVDITLDSNAGKAVDSSRIEELYKKVELLENTVEGLRDELRQANEKSIQMEKSIRSNESILKDESMEDIEQFKFEKDIDLSRPLSPVKVDLDRFKFIR